MLHLKSISVLGCGWLGLPLASRFVIDGFVVKGSTTSQAKLETLKLCGIKPYELAFNPSLNGFVGDFFASRILFLNIPFRRDLLNPSIYQEQITNAVDAFARAGGRWVIFASSTLVYPDQAGLINAGWQEDQALVPQGDRANLLYAVERQLLADKRIDVTIVRFAGLYGPNRELKNFMGRAAHKVGESRVNLIHLDDSIGLIREIVARDGRNQVFNAVSDGHPLRQELYEAIARSEKLPVISFAKGQGLNKIVSNAKAKAVLEYRFKFPDPMTS